MSNLIEHAKKELALVGGSEDEEQQEVNTAILQLLEVFANQGHSGFSASYVLGVFDRLVRFLPVKPLTGEDSEWIEYVEGKFQNKRCPSVFRDEDGTAHDIEAITWTDNDGKSWFHKGNGERYNVMFPYVPLSHPRIRIYLDKDGNELKRVEVDE